MSHDRAPALKRVIENLAGRPARSVGFGVVLLLSSLSAIGGDLRLIEAAKRSDTSAARALIQARIDVNATEVDGTTALHWAASRDDLKMVDLLLSAGADVKAVNRYGISPLLIACNDSGAPVVERL